LRTGAEHAIAQALAGGVRLFQYRNKRGSRKDVYETGIRLARLLRNAGAVFILNDHADIAASVEADGVHLGQEDLPLEYARKLLGPEKLIGISTHSPEQAEAAQAGGADYIGFGPVFRTATKDAGQVQGIDNLKLVRRKIMVPVFAIGGITQKNVSNVIKAGADGVAVITAILSALDITAASADMIGEIRKAEDRRQESEGE
jgi:thiamine-phosphate pyrophosphorylase